MEIKIKGFVYANGTNHYDHENRAYIEGPAFEFWNSDLMAGGEYGKDRVLICPAEFVVEIPDSFDPRAGIVKNLEAEKKRLSEEFGVRVTEIDRQIQTYLAIEA